MDIVIIVRDTSTPFERRAAGWDATSLPVPVDLLVYTEDEWHRMAKASPMGRAMRCEARWVWEAEKGSGP